MAVSKKARSQRPEPAERAQLSVRLHGGIKSSIVAAAGLEGIPVSEFLERIFAYWWAAQSHTKAGHTLRKGAKALCGQDYGDEVQRYWGKTLKKLAEIGYSVQVESMSGTELGDRRLTEPLTSFSLKFAQTEDDQWQRESPDGQRSERSRKPKSSAGPKSKPGSPRKR